MRSERVFTNLTCNQNCTFCTSRASVEDRAFIHPNAVRSRIDEAIRKGAREVVLTGGEPALRRDIADLVSFVKGRDARPVLETNATAIDAERALALAAAGLAAARVNVTGLVPPFDRTTRDEGGAQRTIAGIHALLDAQLPIELEAVIVTSTLDGLPQLPEVLRHEFGDLRAFRVLQIRVPDESPNADELVSYDAAVKVISALEDTARRAQLQLRLAPDSGPPPCVFKHQARVAHLYTLTPGGTRRASHVQVDACAQCQMADRCSGLSRKYLDRFGPPTMQPIEEDRLRRRLSVIGTVEEQVRREFTTLNRYDNGKEVRMERIIRVNFHCNQSCRFCFVSTHLPSVSDEEIRQAIIDAGKAGEHIVLSGGEPTLNPNLVDYVKLAKAHSPHPVNVQTNATRLTDPASVQALADAGLDWVFVSLHGSTAEISDAITEAPGTFEKTIVGLDHLAKTPITVILNFVICRRNYEDLVPYVRFCAERWPKAWLNISFVAPSSDVVPKERALIPQYTEMLPHLARAFDEATRLGVTLVGFESMCGLPLCLVPAELNRYYDFGDIPEGFDGGEFVKPAACERCSLTSKCYGLRRGYRDLYGDAELVPVKAAG
jgi:MoaA/NifB/PqqE/SkfB family radical SAM enzyme